MTVNVVEHAVITAEALWAQRHVSLAPEPPGERSGMAGSTDPAGADTPGTPMRLVAVGDSLVAGCGVGNQAEALVPRIARLLAESAGTPVQWEAHGRLGATMRRVRYRLLPEVAGTPDILFVCAGSNDIMARRSRGEWVEDLTVVLEQASRMARRVVLCSSGQPHRSPALPPLLRRELGRRIDAQTADSEQICQRLGVGFVDVAHAELIPGFWASDRFHPGAAGYEFAAGKVAEAMVARERAA
ncbi:MAG: SGNH/GDSL hydrolase family protein [Actinomyces sp.]|jgi:lysophospholipase L1-like esterase|nr:SGNH/GDSL hydrolase family protein [Actinomyces sp.]MCI1662144.1 SGNH/GDSL hydrolase family protein [Actinomyces sp.]MCI1830975.1 SGNH/GDSL hydrolase family protein [Actinomyces sp.]MCI1866308.1 SGNH/GDSL hydrolase family protein [Actinomyces sp.]